MEISKSILFTTARLNFIKSTLSIILALLFFLWAIDLMGVSFKYLGTSAAESLVLATSNPFIGLFIGLLITAIIQSSSTSTSIVVAVVASGTISLPEAVPIIMGANIGTTLTSTIVSLGFITKPKEYRKALAVGIVHDFFNVIVTAILFPLEYYYGFLSRLAIGITGFIKDMVSMDFLAGDYNFHFLKFGFNEGIVAWVDNFFVILILAFIVLFASIKVLSTIIYSLLIGESKDKLKQYVFGGPYKAFLWGTLVTAGVFSSTVTTSLIVPLGAKGKITLKQAFAFIMGANVGTTITALLASLFKSEAAIAIAIAHLCFNGIGVLIFLPFQTLRDLPVWLASKFSRISINYRLIGFVYIIFTFFIIPFILIYFNQTEIKTKELVIKTEFADGTPDRIQQAIIKIGGPNKTQHWILYNGPDERSNKGTHDQEASKIFDVYQKGNVLFINHQFFLIGKPGTCWDSEDDKGRFTVCLDSIMAKQALKAMSFDSVYAYNKRYHIPSEVDSITTHYLISLPNKMMVRKQKIRNGKVLSSEEVVQLNFR